MCMSKVLKMLNSMNNRSVHICIKATNTISNISDMSNIAVYSVAFDLLLRYFASPTSLT